METRVFTNSVSLMDFISHNKVDILLIGEDVMIDDLNNQQINTVVYLTEVNVSNNEQRYMIFKFQSAEEIIKQLQSYYNAQELLRETNSYSLVGKDTIAIGITSPNGGCGKSTFAIVLGQALSSNKKVLLINLEAIPGKYDYVFLNDEKAAGMSDMIYYIKQRKSNLIVKLRTMVKKIGNIDYLLPADHFSDLYEMDKDDVEMLMYELKNHSDYDYIILDIGYLNDSTYELLKHCEKIYMPVLKDPISREKINSFQRILKMWEGEIIMEKITEVQIPYDDMIAKGEFQSDQLLNGRIGEFVNELLCNGG